LPTPTKTQIGTIKYSGRHYPDSLHRLIKSE
jgi:hypothetical protein